MGEGGVQRRMRAVGAVRVTPAGTSRDGCPPSALRAPSPAGGGKGGIGATPLQRWQPVAFSRRREKVARSAG
ncbi:hypothetical protein DGN16_10365 [Xanthomonas citri pv. fuscans]|nr:hypothetical protein DGN16_10365 [Xanthomonas citri pv. fuscans]QWN08256.1 hypothetical protein DGN11_13235 [Xanthomonas citri pv. fuscans]QWN11930.1 hypothetical protein DGN07_10500 [Xanthomonas citri pv. fuscans]